MTLRWLQISATPHPNTFSGVSRVVCRSALTVIAVLKLLTFDAHAFMLQESVPRSVTPGVPVTGELKGDETAVFNVSLESGRLVNFRVEQRGIMLEATLLDPRNGQVIQLDSPAGAYGPISFSVLTAISGNYRLELKATDEWALTYPYDVFIDEPRDATPQDQMQTAAEKAFSEGRKQYKSGDVPSAIRSYEVANEFWKNTDDYHWRAATQYALSEAYRNSNKEKEAQHLNETLRLVNFQMAANDWRIKASALNDLGAIYMTLSGPNKEEAASLIEQARTLYAAHNDRRGQASALNNLAVMQFRAGNLSAARELVKQVLALRRLENDIPGIGNALNALAAVADRLGEPEEALKYSKESLQQWEALTELKTSDRRRMASVLASVAVASDKLGNWNEALEYYDKALAKYGKDDPLQATTLDNKGELYVVLGDLVKGRQCYEQALKLLEAAGKPDVDTKAGLLVHLGQLSIASGDIPTAIKIFEEALNLDPPTARRANVLTNLATALSMNGNLERAMLFYNNTLEIQKDQRGRALTLQKRGEAYASLGRKEEALNNFRAALPLWQAVKDQRGEASTLNAMARLEQALGDLSAALNHNAEAIRIVESQRTNISSYQLRTSYFAAQENYYALDVDLKMQLSKTEKRNEYVAAALEANEKARARVLLDSLNEAGIERTASSENSDPRLSSLIDERLNLLSILATKAQARTRFLNGSYSPAQIQTLDRELNELSAKYDEMEVKIRSRNPKFAALTKPIPAKLSEIQQQLDADTLLVEYLLGAPRSYAWVVSTEMIEGIELPAGDEIEVLAKRVSRALSERGRIENNESPLRRQQRIKNAESDFKESSSLLSKAVLAPINHLLTKKRLLVVADASLQLVPLTALPDPDSLLSKQRNDQGVQSMIEKHEIISLPSASVLVLQRRELAGRTPAPYALAVIADPVFGRDDSRLSTARNSKLDRDKGLPPNSNSATNALLAESASPRSRGLLTRALEGIGIKSVNEIRRLPFSLQEANAILKTVPPSQRFSALNFTANRRTVLNPKLAQYRNIHLATHGVMDLNHPELSGVLLSMVDENGKEQNGYLGLNDIYTLKWPAELVVLSACETGIGKDVKGEGLIALTRGFMYAGAARVVASLWKVDDYATAVLMAEFYHEMLVNKTNAAAALRTAQLKLSRHPAWRNPHYWAGFVLQGEWR
jgi:CHAT domain-containing protein